MIRKVRARKSQITINGGGRRLKGRPSSNGQRKIARKPVEVAAFPAAAVPILAEMDERHVKRPEQREQDRVGVAAGDETGKREAEPRGRDECGVGRLNEKIDGSRKNP